MASRRVSNVEALTAAHDISEFDCGKPELTQWLRRFALTSQQSESARVYVVHRANTVVGYYALASGGVARNAAPKRIGQGLGDYEIPVILLARLAVHQAEQDKGLGRALLRDAFLRIARAADAVGARALLVHALDDEAKAFYMRFDMEESPTDPLHLFLLMKDLRAALR